MTYGRSASTPAGSPGPPAVIAGSIGSTVSVARSLGRAGVCVRVLNAGLPTLANASRYCAEVIDVGAGPDVADRWLAWLERDGPRGAVILPSGDEGVELIVRHRARLLEAGFLLPEAAGDVSLAMLDKERTYGLARGGGIPCPRTSPVNDAEQLREALPGLSFPCALKPLHSHLFAKHFSTKVLLAADRDELEAAFEQTSALGLAMLVTEIVPGPEAATWTYSTHTDQEGVPLYELTRQKLRALPIHLGTNCYVVTRRNPDVVAAGRRFMEAVGIRGMAHVEFKWDARSEEFKLIECNHRFVAVTELLRRAGLDVALFAYRRAAGLRPPRMEEWREQTRLWFPERDANAARDYRAAGELSGRQWVRSLAHRRVYTPYFAWDDPGPSLAHWAPKVRRLAHRGHPVRS